MDVLYLLSIAACLIQLARTGYARRLPLFALSVVGAIGFEVAYQPYSPEWLRSSYVLFVTPLLTLRALSVAEAFVVSSRGFQHRRLLAAAGVMIALLFAAIIAWRYGGGDVLHSAIHARRVVVVGLAAFLGVYLLLLWSTGYRRSGAVDFHVVMLFALCSVMASTAVLRMAYPSGIWQAANEVSYAACALIYLTMAASYEIPARPHDQPLPDSQSITG